MGAFRQPRYGIEAARAGSLVRLSEGAAWPGHTPDAACTAGPENRGGCGGDRLPQVSDRAAEGVYKGVPCRDQRHPLGPGVTALMLTRSLRA